MAEGSMTDSAGSYVNGGSEPSDRNPANPPGQFFRVHLAGDDEATEERGPIENNPVFRLPQSDVFYADGVQPQQASARVQDVVIEILVRQEGEHPLPPALAAHRASNSAFEGPSPNFASISARNCSASA